MWLAWPSLTIRRLASDHPSSSSSEYISLSKFHSSLIVIFFPAPFLKVIVPVVVGGGGGLNPQQRLDSHSISSFRAASAASCANSYSVTTF